jgi:uncharacterized RDD family membrane protein YckC
MNRIVTQRMTLALGFIISILGIVQLFLPTEEGVTFKQILLYVMPVHFSFFDSMTNFSTNDRSYSIPVFNFLFYIFLLFGSLLYAFKAEKEIRFLRFGFSVIFLSVALYLPFSIFALVKSKLIFFSESPYGGILIFSVIFKILLLIYAYLALKKWQNYRNLSTETTGEGENASTTLVLATKSQRFFHILLDLLVVVISFTPYIGSLSVIGKFLNEIVQKLGEETVILLLLIFARIIYYVFFEALFSATPAKMLTETRVVDFEGEHLGLGRTFKRTLCRFVPFEPFSFFGAYSGWHDLWSDSYIAKEEQRGMKGGLYRWSFLLMALLVYGCYQTVETINTRKSNRERDFRDQKLIEKQIKDLQNISPDYVLTPTIELIPQPQPPVTEGRVTLREEIITQVWKVDRVEGDSLVCLVLPTTSSYATGADIRGVYQQLGMNAETIKISKKDVERTLPAKANEALRFSYEPTIFVNMPDGRTRFGIKAVNAYFGYEFKSASSSYSPSTTYKGAQTMSLSIENLGLNGTLLKIDVLEGSVICGNTTLPQTFKSANYSALTIDCDNYKKGEVFKLLLTIQDSKGAMRQFVMVGIDYQYFIMPN